MSSHLHVIETNPRHGSTIPVVPIALAGLTWNLYGVAQFWSSLSPESSMRAVEYPAWMSAAFAVGVFGGTVGSALLLARNALSVRVLGLSLLGYAVLYIGDVTEGVFAAPGASQVVIMSLVLAIAAGLYGFSLRAGLKT